MTDLELDVWDAWLMERQEHLEETLSNISPSEEPCRYYRERFKFCVNRKTDIRYVISYRGQNLFFRVLSLFVL